MGVRIVGEEPEAGACFYDSVTMRAFGPVFESVADADEFLEYFTVSYPNIDMRSLSDPDLDNLHSDWIRATERDL